VRRHITPERYRAVHFQLIGEEGGMRKAKGGVRRGSEYRELMLR